MIFNGFVIGLNPIRFRQRFDDKFLERTLPVRQRAISGCRRLAGTAPVSLPGLPARVGSSGLASRCRACFGILVRRRIQVLYDNRWQRDAYNAKFPCALAVACSLAHRITHRR